MDIHFQAVKQAVERYCCAIQIQMLLAGKSLHDTFTRVYPIPLCRVSCVVCVVWLRPVPYPSSGGLPSGWGGESVSIVAFFLIFVVCVLSGSRFIGSVSCVGCVLSAVKCVCFPTTSCTGSYAYVTYRFGLPLLY